MSFVASSSRSPRPSTQPSPAAKAPAANLWDLAASAVGRGVALFVALFTLFNLVLQWALLPRGLASGFDPNQWWINFRPLPPWFETLFLLAASGALLWYAILPTMPGLRRRITLSFCELLGLLAIWNALYFFRLVGRHSIYHGNWFPFSLLVVIALLVVWRGVFARQQATGGAAILGMLIAFLGAAIVIPLGQIACFGAIDYRRQADTIVVFGAGLDPQDRSSAALHSRVDLAIELYHQQVQRKELPPQVILAGAPGPDEGFDQATAMWRLARDAKIPESDLMVVRSGANIQATIENSTPVFSDLSRQLDLLDQQRPLRVLVISHPYNLARIKMTYQREEALTIPLIHWQIFTVPAPGVPAEGHLLLNDVVAQWAYYLRSLFS